MPARMQNKGNLLLGGKAKWDSHFGGQVGSFLHSHVMLPYDWAIPLLGIYKWVENLCLHKIMQMDVYGNFIHNYPKLETNKISFNKWVDNPTMVHPDNEMLFSAKKKWAIKKWKDKEKPYMHIAKWKEVWIGYLLRDSLEKAKL